MHGIYILVESRVSLSLFHRAKHPESLINHDHLLLPLRILLHVHLGSFLSSSLLLSLRCFAKLSDSDLCGTHSVDLGRLTLSRLEVLGLEGSRGSGEQIVEFLACLPRASITPLLQAVLEGVQKCALDGLPVLLLSLLLEVLVEVLLLLSLLLLVLFNLLLLIEGLHYSCLRDELDLSFFNLILSVFLLLL